MNSTTAGKKQLKKPYSKPVLDKIDLVVDEVMSVGCKTIASGPLGNGCRTSGVFNDGGS